MPAQWRPNARWMQVSEIVAAALDQVEQTLRQHQVETEGDQDVPVRLDPRLTANALAHVLENAAQYAPPGTIVRLSTSPGQRGLTIRVRDHGPGIAPADLPHLFDRFYRGSAARTRASGTGMGLWIARGLLAVQHGRVWAENCPDGGAQFTIVVPAEMRVSASPRPRHDRRSDARILLVDDEPSIQRAVGPLLRSRGYQVEIAGTGADALRAFADRPPDLVVLDLGLPDLEGTEVCRRIRARRPKSRSSCCRRAGPRPTRSTRSTWARTTT